MEKDSCYMTLKMLGGVGRGGEDMVQQHTKFHVLPESALHTTLEFIALTFV